MKSKWIKWVSCIRRLSLHNWVPTRTSKSIRSTKGAVIRNSAGRLSLISWRLLIAIKALNDGSYRKSKLNQSKRNLNLPPAHNVLPFPSWFYYNLVVKIVDLINVFWFHCLFHTCLLILYVILVFFTSKPLVSFNHIKVKVLGCFVICIVIM